jgi:hypothetical protein
MGRDDASQYPLRSKPLHALLQGDPSLGCHSPQPLNAIATGDATLTCNPSRSPSWQSPPMVDENRSSQLDEFLLHPPIHRVMDESYGVS